jgi:hypothetical protein
LAFRSGRSADLNHVRWVLVPKTSSISQSPPDNEFETYRRSLPKISGDARRDDWHTRSRVGVFMNKFGLMNTRSHGQQPLLSIVLHD